MKSGWYGPNEIGAPICRYPGGRYAFGPFSEGTPMNVSVTTRCPPGSIFDGTAHSHPGGVALPSQIDVRSALKTGSRVLCVFADGDLRCYNVVKK